MTPCKLCGTTRTCPVCTNRVRVRPASRVRVGARWVHIPTGHRVRVDDMRTITGTDLHLVKYTLTDPTVYPWHPNWRTFVAVESTFVEWLNEAGYTEEHDA